MAKTSVKSKGKIKLTKEFKQAFETIEKTKKNIFLTGRAGTGKSTLLKYFRKKTKKKHIVLAPTGVAALNVKGQTIHSFFGFHPQITKQMVRKASDEKRVLMGGLQTIVIDEISMVRADLLDCIDASLRLNRKSKEPFGGVQMIFIGDLFQLPPVVTRDETDRFKTEYESPYFFSADVMRHTPIEIIELKTVHRQTENHFIDLLEKVRMKSLDYDDLTHWNECHNPYFDPREETGYIHLTTTNKMAHQRNQYELKQLSGKEWKLRGKSEGQIPDRRMPSDALIAIKEGARIMFTVNDPEKRFVNGSLGTVKKIKKNGLSKDPILVIELENGTQIKVARHTWELFEYTQGDNGPTESVVGSFSQYPIALAWAVTIHKSQGKTFDKVLVDIGWGAFAHGQMYVALSRCTTFDGLVLMKPLKQKDVILDRAVVQFMNGSQI